MDLVLLVVQVVLVILMIVIPLFSGYDKWQQWSSTRKVIAIALGAGIAVVALGQYKHIVLLRNGGLPKAFGGFEKDTPWFLRPVVLAAWEYLGTVVAGGVLLGLAFQAAQRRRWAQCAGCTMVFLLMTSLGVALKLRFWR